MPAIVLAQVAFVSWVTRCCRLPLAGNKLARERHGLIELAGAVLGRWLDLAALVPLVPRRYQYIVRRRSDRLLPEDAVGLPIPTVGDRARRRARGVAVVITGDHRHGRDFPRACRRNHLGISGMRPDTDLGRRFVSRL